MNAYQRRKARRKLKSDGVKKAYARIGGKIIEVEILDEAYSPKKRAPVTMDEGGNVIEEKPPGSEPKTHPNFHDLAEALLRQIFKPINS
jgi:hypothetical protein